MNQFKLISFSLLFSAFIFGIGDRILSSDLNSAGISMIVLTFLIPLCPLIK